MNTIFYACAIVIAWEVGRWFGRWIGRRLCSWLRGPEPAWYKASEEIQIDSTITDAIRQQDALQRGFIDGQRSIIACNEAIGYETYEGLDEHDQPKGTFFRPRNGYVVLDDGQFYKIVEARQLPSNYIGTKSVEVLVGPGQVLLVVDKNN